MWLIDIPWYIWLPIIALSIFAAVQAITDTNGAPKTAAYLLLIIMLPVIGPIIYFSVGINYRKNKIFSKKIIDNENRIQQIREQILNDSDKLREKHDLSDAANELINFLLSDTFAPLTKSKVQVLINGEEKFPEVLKALENAKEYIHIEYYIFEDDQIGNKVKDVLVEKAQQGVEVRLIYDDFGCKGLKTIGSQLKKAGVDLHAFHKVRFYNFTNSLNYRDHRKIIIIDGRVGFVGGINIADRYVNGTAGNKFYWRDTHLKLMGDAVKSLQQHFFSNWNFLDENNLEVNKRYFPESNPHEDGDLVQIIPGGPDYSRSGLMLSLFTAITGAKHLIYITTPYFIPNETLQNSLVQAAISGKDVRILVPQHSDSKLVDYASQFYFREMLKAGVRIYRYQKGFVHAKSLIVDDDLSILGSANLDLRSFEINFEMNAAIYSRRFNEEMKKIYFKDLEECVEVDKEEWIKRGKFEEFRDSLARILSPLL